ncbi:MAG TPA: MlaD family protein [Bacteroidales bacterium]|jgi:phospholipid/cholesterol/gamma-HCH transport system substrate-binding protein|nr:MlaD family protein [Bacteroidales bacterium]
METHSIKFKIRLGLFVLAGSALFIIAIFLIGKQKNLFNPVFRVSTTFSNVSGLQVGNNVRFAGINVGTVGNISIINDSTVKVDMLIRSTARHFIKDDCVVTMGSEGIIGDRILVIMQGGPSSSLVKDGQLLLSKDPVETDELMNSLHETVMNAEIISGELAQIMIKINSGQGTLGKLIQDTTIARNLDATIINLKNSSKGLDDNMNAAKDNILLRGYFRRKEREAAKAAAAKETAKNKEGTKQKETPKKK